MKIWLRRNIYGRSFRNCGSLLGSVQIFGFLMILPLLMIATGISPVFALPPSSLYNVETEWTDDKEHKIKLSEFASRPVIITMAFASCSTACPLTMGRLKRLDNKLKESNRTAEIVVVSFDPERDTPKALKNYRESKNLEESNWHFLTGQPDDVRKLSHLLGISFQADQVTKDIIHSNKLLLLDRDGTIKVVVDGLNSDPQPIIDSVLAMNP